MNERIKELYEQAHEQKPIIVMDSVTFEPIHKIGNCDKPMYHKVFNPEKFAELIVTDCCQMMLDLEVKYSAGLTVLEIKKQFGLK